MPSKGTCFFFTLSNKPHLLMRSLSNLLKKLKKKILTLRSPKCHHLLYLLVIIFPSGAAHNCLFSLSTWQPGKYLRRRLMDKWPLHILSTKIFPVCDCEASYSFTFAIFCPSYPNLSLPANHVQISQPPSWLPVQFWASAFCWSKMPSTLRCTIIFMTH